MKMGAISPLGCFLIGLAALLSVAGTAFGLCWLIERSDLFAKVFLWTLSITTVLILSWVAGQIICAPNVHP